MVNNFYLYAGFILCLAALLYIIAYYLKSEIDLTLFKLKNEENNKYNFTKAEDLFVYLDFLMDMEFSFEIELPFKGKDIERITNFENTLNELTHGVIKSINYSVIENAINLGINEDYIYSYITRGCTIRILNFIKEKNSGIQPKKEEE